MKEVIAGVDEVGRGCLAGPVIVAAVVLKKNITSLDDSKKISSKKRLELSELILKNSFYAFGAASEKEIDKINILQATLLAMKRAILNLSVVPDKVLVDGIYKPDIDLPIQTIVGGDSLISEISAASIIAKVYRDNLMITFDKNYPEYGFSKHKGYGTKMHLQSIMTHGPCHIHRKTFKGVK